VLSYLIKRLGGIGLGLLGISIIVFIAMRSIPGDPTINFIGEGFTQARADQLRKSWGLDQPIYVQYFIWVKNVITGNLGVSISSHNPVIDEIGARLPNTIVLAVASVGAAILIGLGIGIISGIKPYSWFDNLAMLASFLGLSVPPFWFGLLLMWVFAVELGWFPATGGGSIQYLVLPTTAMAVRYIASIARQTRASLLEVMRTDYIKTARSKGASTNTIIFKHALRNALIPVITVTGMIFGLVLGGSVMIEIVFAYPGIGKYLIESIFSRDYPVVQGIILVYAAMFMFINLIVDILYGIIDPRVRYT
jgi:peptide/nickel transport system permease protein